MSVRIAWIDVDADHARCAQDALREVRPHWLVVPISAPGFRLAPAQDWDAVVLSLGVGEVQLPPWTREQAPWPLMLCLHAGGPGGAMAARGPGRLCSARRGRPPA